MFPFPFDVFFLDINFFLSLFLPLSNFMHTFFHQTIELICFEFNCALFYICIHMYLNCIHGDGCRKTAFSKNIEANSKIQLFRSSRYCLSGWLRINKKKRFPDSVLFVIAIFFGLCYENCSK